jgi:hypothetical protein
MIPEIRQALKDPQPLPMSPALLRQRLEKLGGLIGENSRTAYAALVALIYPNARAYLLSHGRTAEQLDALPLTQVVLMFELAQYDRWMDEYAKVYSLPYWQARPQIAKVDQALGNRKADPASGGLLASMLIPATGKVLRAQVRTQRRVAMLRTVEALRLYAAAHQGSLPETLDDLRDVPVPLDPMTGKAFGYIRHGPERVTLDAPPPPGEQAWENNALRYEITLAPLTTNKE